MNNLKAESMDKVDLTGRLLADMASLCLSESYADVEFLVEQQKLPAHRVVLAVRSEYFRALLFGGMSESSQRQIQMDVRLDLFKLLLEYIYTGNLSIATLKEDVLIDVLGIADQYGFQDLLSAISKYLSQSLTMENVTVLLNAARLNNVEDLTQACLSFMDSTASNLLQHDSLKLLSMESLEMVLQRDTFYAPEREIFQGVLKWIRCNQAVNTESLWEAVRLSLIGIDDLMELVRPMGIVDCNKINDAIAQIHSRNLPYRSRLTLGKNVATAEYSAQCIAGWNSFNLLNGDVTNYQWTTGFTAHTIGSNDDGILVELGDIYNINHIRLLLWDRDHRIYSYFIEISADKVNWKRVVDYSEYHCGSWQYLYFEACPVRFIRTVGTYNNKHTDLHLVSLEAMHARDVPKLINHVVAPVNNVATVSMHAHVRIESYMNFSNFVSDFNVLINGNCVDYDESSGYIFNQVGPGQVGIIVRLRQPYHVGSIRLLLWDRDNRHYSFYIETSTNYVDWMMAVDKRNEEVRSWQNFYFTPRPVVYIRVVGTRSRANHEIRLVHLECPSQESDVSTLQ
ncbi:BTB/POZ domain-containing protein 9-like [Drosophila tropicalis]|uniref:BTB/POZ domain-containing protein 9-like n=1 Tax=Drosophila tropicalis TaxID=46794 RepID=UPI0035AB6BC0